VIHTRLGSRFAVRDDSGSLTCGVAFGLGGI
jgi:hypothetical protein